MNKRRILIIAIGLCTVQAVVVLLTDLGRVHVAQKKVESVAKSAATFGAYQLPLEKAAQEQALDFIRYEDDGQGWERRRVIINAGDSSTTISGAAEADALLTIWIDTAFSRNQPSPVKTADGIRVTVRKRVPMLWLRLVGLSYIPVEASAESWTVVETPILAKDNDPALEYKWNLKEVTYIESQESFTPKSYQGFTLAEAHIFWSDGCNRYQANYVAHQHSFNLRPAIASTLIYCSFEREDVHYDEVISYTLSGNVLTLTSPTQIYTLEKFPYSRMSMNDWSLDSIIDRRTGAARDLNRFRHQYQDLFLHITDDKSFYFRDLDGEEFTGTLEVKEGQLVKIEYDAASKLRLENKEKLYDYLSDNTNDYKPTQTKYATTYADELEWDSVKSFKIEDRVLYFYGDDFIYKFGSR